MCKGPGWSEEAGAGGLAPARLAGTLLRVTRGHRAELRVSPPSGASMSPWRWDVKAGSLTLLPPGHVQDEGGGGDAAVRTRSPRPEGGAPGGAHG